MLGVGAADAAPGDLDPSFGGDGKVEIGFENGGTPDGIAAQPDGKIVVAGTTSNRIAVVRLNPDGSPDDDFGSGGRAILPLGPIASASAIALQPDGKIVVVGSTTETHDGVATDFGIMRLTAAGAPDPEFSDDGRYTVGFGGGDLPLDVELQADGKIVVAGYSVLSGTPTNADFVLTRLNTDGNIDTSFNGGGPRIEFGGNDYATDVSVRPSGEIVAVGGTTSTVDGRSMDFAAAQLRTDGTLDGAFGTAGRVTIGFGGNELPATGVLTPDGHIASPFKVEQPSGIGVMRIDVAGKLDSTFGQSGLARFSPFSINEASVAMALQSDGKLVVGSYGAQQSTSAADGAVTRLGTDGSVDPSFGVGGTSVVSFGDASVVQGLALEPDGKIVIASQILGAPSDRFGVARLLGDGPSGGGDGGGNDDDVLCAGEPATITGTDGRDKLKGTGGADVIAALGGNDSVKARGGKDVVCLGSGNDSGKGGAGGDTLRGESGRDKLVGQAGGDKLVGGGGRDRCAGGAGADRSKCENEA